ncbi:phage tail tube protein [Streptomyces sp. NPDC006458]|uniref:phage tail tube protein n=1 Tax=Streptomyces sp. NPDC006458 TaxID=3154302 RepID=UPI0033A7739C
MATVHDQYFGVADEVTYGTGVAPTKFYEFQSEGVQGNYERINSEAVRAGTKTLRSDRFATSAKGAEGDLKLEVVSGGFDFWLKHMLGAVSAGAPSGGLTTYTATVGQLDGKSFTAQVGRVDNTGALTPFTYEGGKVKEWEISNAVDELVTLSLTLDFGKETIGAGSGAYAVSTPTYVANTKLLAFNGGSVKVGGTDFPVSDFSLKADNGLNVERYFIRAGAKGEQREEGLRSYEWSLKGEFAGTTHINRVAAAVASGALASIEASWSGPDGSQLKVELPFGRFDEGPVTVGGFELVEQELSGVGLTDGAASAVTITYKAVS